MNLYRASNQWQTRPNDERFDTPQALLDATLAYRASAVEAEAKLQDIRVEARPGALAVIGKSNRPAELTYFAAGQFAGYLGAPIDYLRTLPGTLAAQNLNYKLAHAKDEAALKLLFHNNGSMVLRGMSSPKYTRIWNSDVARRLVRLQDESLGAWRVPPARPCREDQPGVRLATEADVLQVANGSGLSIKVGDPIAPAGLYASDHDMFAFMINEDRRIDEPGNPDGLSRGFFVSNWELPGASFWIEFFYYRSVCGNHIVWDAKRAFEVKVPHIGNADERALEQLTVELTKYADESASEDEAKVKVAKTFVLGTDKDEVLDAVFGKVKNISRRALSAGYDLAEEHSDVDGSPRTAWGLAQGVTRFSQQSPYGDVRTKLDVAAGDIIQIAF